MTIDFSNFVGEVSRAFVERPSTADTTATRPTTANSLLSSDPFASPVSRRPHPSIRHLQPPSSPSASRVSFPDSLHRSTKQALVNWQTNLMPSLQHGLPFAFPQRPFPRATVPFLQMKIQPQNQKHPECVLTCCHFENENAVFGPGGTFLREVNMDGFG